jgi:hypothetical protein
MYITSAVFLITAESDRFYITCIQISCETYSMCSPVPIVVKAAEWEADHSLLSRKWTSILLLLMA